jgi:hypothetical protein
VLLEQILSAIGDEIKRADEAMKAASTRTRGVGRGIWHLAYTLQLYNWAPREIFSRNSDKSNRIPDIERKNLQS